MRQASFLVILLLRLKKYAEGLGVRVFHLELPLPKISVRVASRDGSGRSTTEHDGTFLAFRTFQQTAYSTPLLGRA